MIRIIPIYSLRETHQQDSQKTLMADRACEMSFREQMVISRILVNLLGEHRGYCFQLQAMRDTQLFEMGIFPKSPGDR